MRRVEEQLPYMSTEAIIVKAVQKGLDRLDVHEIIRKHSMAATESAKRTGGMHDLFTRLAQDSDLGMSLDELRELADPKRFIGRAPEQVTEFLQDVVSPIVNSSDKTETEPQEILV
jgi:adenylosuccinate lyase